MLARPSLRDTMSDELTTQVESSQTIEEGTHLGRVADLSIRETNFENDYLNFDIDLVDEERGQIVTTLNFGFPFKVTERTLLGKLLKQFGVQVDEPGVEVDVGEELIGEYLQFETYMKKTEDGEYAEIDKESVRKAPGNPSPLKSRSIGELEEEFEEQADEDQSATVEDKS